MEQSESDDKVVLQQTLLRVPETFVYKVPPMATSGGFRAEDWNLAYPLATCSLLVKRVDDSLYIQLFKDAQKLDGPVGAREEHLFAQCKTSLRFMSKGTSLNMDYWVDTVVDSSRYFVLRISDEKNKREAHIGIGFRERSDATNFKMSLDDYQRAMKREAMFFQKSHTPDGTENPESRSITDHSCESFPKASARKINTLKEGEKMHINIKGYEGKSKSRAISAAKVESKLLLKKPPSSSSGQTNVFAQDDDDLRKEYECASELGEQNSDEDIWSDFESAQP
jgi:Protein of unknown function (DUF1681).